MDQQQWSWSPLRSWGIIQVAVESGSRNWYVLEPREQPVLAFRGTGATAQLGTLWAGARKQQPVQPWFDTVP